jgi:hypothetical protein
MSISMCVYESRLSHSPGSDQLYTIWWRIQIMKLLIMHVKSEVFMAVTMKNAVFWDVTPCSSCVNRRFGGTYRLHLQGRKIRKQGTTVVQTSVSLTIIQIQSPSCPMSGLYSIKSAECCPSTTSNQWAYLPRKYLVSSEQSKITWDLGLRVNTESPECVAKSTLGRQAVPWIWGWRSISSTSILNIQTSRPWLNTAST